MKVLRSRVKPLFNMNTNQDHFFPNSNTKIGFHSALQQVVGPMILMRYFVLFKSELRLEGKL